MKVYNGFIKTKQGDWYNISHINSFVVLYHEELQRWDIWITTPMGDLDILIETGYESRAGAESALESLLQWNL